MSTSKSPDPPSGSDDAGGSRKRRGIKRKHQKLEKEPLVSCPKPIESLKSENPDDAAYTAKVTYLASKYREIRLTRPDENCFNLAFAFAYLEFLVRNKEEFDTFLEYCSIARERMKKSGFPRDKCEGHFTAFMGVVDEIYQSTIGCGDNITLAVSKLFRRVFYEGYWRELVDDISLLAASQPHQRDFVCEKHSYNMYWDAEVTPTYDESDQDHITDICNAFNIGIRIEYMDRGEENQVLTQDFPDGSEPTIFLLYRPGHYDILYPIEGQ